MAGKHLKSFFDFNRSTTVDNIVPSQRQKRVAFEQASMSLPFKIIIVVLVISLALSSVLVGSFFISGKIHKGLLTDAAKIFEASDSAAAIKTLSDENSDIKGWLKIDGTDINCAVCQTDNDIYYINHNQKGKKSRYGALFLSAADSFTRDGDKNIVIYGNNMKDGTMFGMLKKYRNLNFYKQNPDINLYYGDEAENYIIFAVMLIGYSENDAGSAYNPSKSYFVDEAEFNEWYNETAQRSLINTTVTAQYSDEFLTLVTVADDFDGARLVVLAKKTTEWDISHTDVSGATVNAKIKYPKKWYIERGMEYPY